ncbi:PEGA domain-containing protein [Polyangium jinanense]|uniref:PEGA domain-containing protein n=1 Tax=Polyangium jinanense TaxID=2829994 RepID=UPI0023413969|nr:PEGA domain-containing protein [Polyangium jinanense]MDC3955534.1 PEGA domain-containing protein [Polyangium jinanense]
MSRVAALLVTATLLAPSLALAAEPSSADKETARNLMKEGDAKFASKDYAGALKAYQAAHAIMQVPSTGLPLARAQIERGLLVEARDTLLQVSRHPKDANEPAAFVKAREEAADLAQKLATRIPSLVIVVEGVSSDVAAVAVDGASIPSAALSAPRKVNPGSHTVTASASGFHAASATVNVKEGANEKVTLKLVPADGSKPPPAPSSPAQAIQGGGKLRIESSAHEGNVFIDGKAVGATPLEVPVTAGVHEVEIQYPGGTNEKKQATVDAGKTERVEFRPSPMDEVARYRKGLHFGGSFSPAMAVYTEGGAIMFGAAAGFVMNIGITPMFDFRTGGTLTVVHRFNENPEYQATQVSVVVPAMLRVNWSPWFSSAAGLSAGFVADLQTDPVLYGASVGPEWSLLSMCAGDRRQYEISFSQGLRFGQARRDFHQLVTFTYLSL